MPEFDYFNGENFITFDLIEIDDEKREVTVAVHPFIVQELSDAQKGKYP